MKYLLLCLVFVSTSVQADLSARREKDQDYRQKVKMSFLKPSPQLTALDEAGDFKDLEADFVAEWSQKDLQPRFEEIRDERFIEVRQGDGFLRRISWLYPDDGCFARAAMAIQRAEEKQFEVPQRVFIFGNLNVETENSVSGEVSWWYHTAPVVRVNDQVYVLDAAIDPSKPLKIEEWILKQVPDLSEAEVAYCDGGSYGPYSYCKNPSDSDDFSALSDQKNYLNYEWYRQESLGRDPLLVLGDQPPWLM